MLQFIASVFLLSTCSAPSTAADERYFPPGVFDPDDADHDRRTASRYTSYLRAAGEPALPGLTAAGGRTTVYRLLWLPPFHPPIFIRIVKSDKIVAHIVKLDGKGGYEPGKVSAKLTKAVTEGQWDSLQRLLERSAYWKMPTTVEAKFAAGLVLDGDQLVCEAVEGKRYHVVDRDEPRPDYQKLCKFMLELSGLDVGKTWAHYHGQDEKEDGKGGGR